MALTNVGYQNVIDKYNADVAMQQSIVEEARKRNAATLAKLQLIREGRGPKLNGPYTHFDVQDSAGLLRIPQRPLAGGGYSAEAVAGMNKIMGNAVRQRYAQLTGAELVGQMKPPAPIIPVLRKGAQPMPPPSTGLADFQPAAPEGGMPQGPIGGPPNSIMMPPTSTQNQYDSTTEPPFNPTRWNPDNLYLALGALGRAAIAQNFTQQLIGEAGRVEGLVMQGLELIPMQFFPELIDKLETVYSYVRQRTTDKTEDPQAQGIGNNTLLILNVTLDVVKEVFDTIKRDGDNVNVRRQAAANARLKAAQMSFSEIQRRQYEVPTTRGRMDDFKRPEDDGGDDGEDKPPGEGDVEGIPEGGVEEGKAAEGDATSRISSAPSSWLGPLDDNVPTDNIIAFTDYYVNIVNKWKNDGPTILKRLLQDDSRYQRLVPSEIEKAVDRTFYGSLTDMSEDKIHLVMNDGKIIVVDGAVPIPSTFSAQEVSRFKEYYRMAIAISEGGGTAPTPVEVWNAQQTKYFEAYKKQEQDQLTRYGTVSRELNIDAATIADLNTKLDELAKAVTEGRAYIVQKNYRYELVNEAPNYEQLLQRSPGNVDPGKYVPFPSRRIAEDNFYATQKQYWDEFTTKEKWEQRGKNILQEDPALSVDEVMSKLEDIWKENTEDAGTGKHYLFKAKDGEFVVSNGPSEFGKIKDDTKDASWHGEFITASRLRMESAKKAIETEKKRLMDRGVDALDKIKKEAKRRADAAERRKEIAAATEANRAANEAEKAAEEVVARAASAAPEDRDELILLAEEARTIAEELRRVANEARDKVIARAEAMAPSEPGAPVAGPGAPPVEEAPVEEAPVDEEAAPPRRPEPAPVAPPAPEAADAPKTPVTDAAGNVIVLDEGGREYPIPPIDKVTGASGAAIKAWIDKTPLYSNPASGNTVLDALFVGLDPKRRGRGETGNIGFYKKNKDDKYYPDDRANLLQGRLSAFYNNPADKGVLDPYSRRKAKFQFKYAT